MRVEMTIKNGSVRLVKDQMTYGFMTVIFVEILNMRKNRMRERRSNL